MKILSFGSLNIDYTYRVDHFVRKGETLASDGLQVFSGGKGLNQSVALAKAGAETYHAGAIGRDGQFLLEQLERDGVNTDLVTVLENTRTGNAIIQNDKEGDNCILLYGGANQAITREQVDAVLSHFQQGDYILLQNEISQLPYIVSEARRRGMKVVLNPSPMNEKIGQIPLEYVDMFLLNEIEAAQILAVSGTDELPAEELIQALHDRFPEAAIVLTLGGAGAMYMDSQQFFRQPSYKVRAVDTTAAGDTFTGFFIGSIMTGLPVDEAMSQASKAAAIAVTRPGAAPSIPTYAEVEEWQFEV